MEVLLVILNLWGPAQLKKQHPSHSLCHKLLSWRNLLWWGTPRCKPRMKSELTWPPQHSSCWWSISYYLMSRGSLHKEHYTRRSFSFYAECWSWVEGCHLGETLKECQDVIPDLRNHLLWEEHRGLSRNHLQQQTEASALELHQFCPHFRTTLK